MANANMMGSVEKKMTAGDMGGACCITGKMDCTGNGCTKANVSSMAKGHAAMLKGDKADAAMPGEAPEGGTGY